MVTFKGFKVTIQVNGEDVQEYEAGGYDEFANDTITRYIKAESDVEFKMKTEYIGDGPIPGLTKKGGIIYHAHTDGQKVKSFVISGIPYKKVIATTSVYVSGKRFVRNFRFADLEVEEAGHGDQNNIEVLKEKLQDIGTIEVVVFRYMSREKCASNKRLSTKLDISGKIPEEAMKGNPKSHFVRLGECKETSLRSHWKSALLDKPPCHFAKFIFKYRSQESLRELHILKSPETPEAPDNESTHHIKEENPSTFAGGQALLQESNSPRLPAAQDLAGLSKGELLMIVGRLQIEARIVAELSRDELMVHLGRIQQVGGQQASNAGSASRFIKRERDLEHDNMLGTATAKRVARGTESDAVDLTED